MSNELDVFREKFQVDALTLEQSEHWVLSIRPQQLTLGSMVLSVRSNVLDFASLNQAQSSEMALLLGEAELRVKKYLGAIRINALCLMMQDPLLHFHIFPRYESVVRFEGEDWVDSDWPKPPIVRPTEVQPRINQALLSTLRQSTGV